ncbi:hypothetical protein ALQ40_101305, partial [Pseudomonas syringae]
SPRKAPSLFVAKAVLLARPALQDQRGVGATETEAVAHDQIELGVFLGFEQDRHVGNHRVQLFDVGRTCDEVVLHHQQAVDRFVDTCGAQRVPRQALGGADRRSVGAEYFAHAFHFLGVADRSRGAVGVDVVNGTRVDVAQRHLHATNGTFTAGCDHVVAIGGRAVADDFCVDLRATRQCVFEFFDNHHAATTSNDKTVTLGVVGTRGFIRRFVVLGGQCAHRVEQERLAPVLFFAATGKDDVLFAQLDLLDSVADAVCAGGAGGRDGVVHTLDLEWCGQAGRNGAAHRPGDAVGANALDAFLTQGIQRFHLVQGRGAAAAGDQAGTHVGNLLFGQARIGDSVFHRQVGIGCRMADEAEDLAIDQLFQIQVDGAGNLAAQTHFGIFRVEADARAVSTQVSGDGLFVIAQAGNNTQTSDNDAAHASTLRNFQWK